jgi:putative hydrolase of the HAD superfamily
MSTIKHISFDLWMTLIKSNPKFKVERAKYFFDFHNRQQKSFFEITQFIREIDVMCNEINEINGNSISSEEMNLMVLYKINDTLENYDSVLMVRIYNEINELFENNSPTLFDHNTLTVLENLKRKNYSMSLLSNTAFIKGKSLTNILDKLNISDFFEFLFFSDEYNLSKPNQKFFSETFDKIKNETGVYKSEVVHIGDNYKADYLGSKLFGYQPILINSNDKSILELNNL